MPVILPHLGLSAARQRAETIGEADDEGPLEIDAISGATITSNAVGKGLNDSAQALAPVVQKHLKEIEEAGK